MRAGVCAPQLQRTFRFMRDSDMRAFDPSPLVRSHTHEYTQTHAHAHTHTHTHSHAHTNTHARTRARTHAHALTTPHPHTGQVEACRDLGLHFRVTAQNDSSEFLDKAPMRALLLLICL